VSGPHLVVLAAGGTGGHVFPAEALATALDRRGHPLALVTDRRGAAYGGVLGDLQTHRIHAGTLRPGLMGKVAGIAQLGLGLIEARRLLRDLGPAVVVGFGGYPSVPTMLAAAQLRLPTVIHEQNAVLGRANRLLARRVSAIGTAFPGVRGLAPGRAVLTGNPVRPAVARAAAAVPYRPPGDAEALRLLVTGGSQGARIFSRVIPAAIAGLPAPLRGRIALTQQCRPEDLEAVRAIYRDAAVAAELSPFFADLPERLAQAHLLICRSGASTVAELAAAGRPAILVPYAHATDDHQTANAQALAEAGGAWLMAEAAFTPTALATRIEAVLAEPASLAAMAAAAAGLARADAAERLADMVEGLMPANGAERPTRRAA